jgi:hypothetical protein
MHCLRTSCSCWVGCKPLLLASGLVRCVACVMVSGGRHCAARHLLCTALGRSLSYFGLAGHVTENSIFWGIYACSGYRSCGAGIQISGCRGQVGAACGFRPGFCGSLGACSGAGPMGWCPSAPCTLVHCDYVCCFVTGVCEGAVGAAECPARQALGAKLVCIGWLQGFVEGCGELRLFSGASSPV